MKSTFIFTLAALAVPGSPLLAQPAAPLAPVAVVSPAAAALKAIDKSYLDKKYDEALAQAEAALRLPDLTAAEKLRLLKAASEANAARGAAGLPAAMANQESIVTDPLFANAAKIEALNALANLYIKTQDGLDLQEMDVSRAVAAVDRGLQLPGLTVADRALALTNIGKLQERQDKGAQARETYKQVLALEVDARTKAATYKLIADSLAKEGKADEAVAIYTEQKFNLLDVYTLLGDNDKRFELSFKILDDKSLPEAQRWNAFYTLPVFDRGSWYADQMQSLSEKYVPGLQEKDPNRVLNLKRFVTPEKALPAYVLWAAPLMLKAPGISAADTIAVKTSQLEALAATGQMAPFTAEAAGMAADEKLPAATRLWARLIGVGLKAGTPAELNAALKDAGTLTMQEKADTVLRAAKTLNRINSVAAAANLLTYQQGLLVQRPKASITCRFVARSPIDVGSWLASPILKSKDSKAKLDRPYGDNLKFLLETDSAVMGRNTSVDAKKDTGDSDTDFYVACDANGLSLFLYARDTRVNEVANGLLSGGSFEIYLAPGARNAYYTYLLSMPGKGNDPTGFETMYPNPTYRKPSPKDGTLQVQSWKTDSGYANSLFLSWEAFYDKLPENGKAWQFDAIRWSRSGGLSFGGSESVHNRSSWGDIVFEGFTPENLNAIKRQIVFRALAKYKASKTMTGPVGNWPDRQLGDPAFFAAKVEPYFQKLDSYAKLVTNDMTAAQVETVFREAVPEWMEIESRVGDLRREWVEAKVMGE